jgi:hypothetical protein
VLASHRSPRGDRFFAGSRFSFNDDDDDDHKTPSSDRYDAEQALRIEHTFTEAFLIHLFTLQESSFYVTASKRVGTARSHFDRQAHHENRIQQTLP